MENKTGKYIKYAIGEIVLVMIGILLALQVNNWNEERKESNLEIQYLESIQKDLYADIKYYDRRIKECKMYMDIYYHFVHKMYETQNNFDEFAKLWESFDFPSEHLSIQNFTFNELVGSGNIGILKNKTLKDSIVSLYKTSDETAKYVQEFNEFTANHILLLWEQPDMIYPMELTKRKKDLFDKEIMYQGLDWSFINNPNSYFFKILRNDIGLYFEKLRDFSEKFNTLKMKCDETVSMIEKELDKRK